MYARVLLLLTVTGVLVCGAWAWADVHLLLSIPGVSGGSTVPGYQDCIECFGLQHNIPGLVQPPQLLHSGPRLQAGSFQVPHNFEGFDVMATYDKSSPKLAHSCSQGRRLGTVALLLLSVVDQKPEVLFSFQLDDPVLSTLIVRAPGFGDRSQLLLPLGNDKPLVLLKFMPQRVTWQPMIAR